MNVCDAAQNLDHIPGGDECLNFTETLMMVCVCAEFELMHVDEFIDDLLHAERICDIILPRLQVR